MKTLTFLQALHIVAFLVAALLTKFVQGQIPDTLYYEPHTVITEEDTTSGFILYTSATLTNSQIPVIQPIDQLMDSSEVAEYAFDLIYQNEYKNWVDEARLMDRQKSARLYAPVNNIIRDMYGYGFFVMTRQKFGSGYEGKWIARINGGDIIWFTVDSRLNMVETEMDWTPKEGGRSGRMILYTENRCKVQSFFAEADQRDFFNKQFDSPFYVSETNGNRIILRKVR
jgi:hypothetical protein